MSDDYNTSAEKKLAREMDPAVLRVGVYCGLPTAELVEEISKEALHSGHLPTLLTMFSALLATLSKQADATADKNLALARESAATADKNLKIAEDGLIMSARNLKLQDRVLILSIAVFFFTALQVFLAVSDYAERVQRHHDADKANRLLQQQNSEAKIK